MTPIIRSLKLEEWDAFMRFLEKCYGHSRNYFPRYYPQLYRREEEALSSFIVVEEDGKIVSHVGLFPLDLVSLNARATAGGIGGVATLPEERNKGYMSMLLKHAGSVMKQKGWPLSVLWGDRQRYYPFGWDAAGLKYLLTITTRSLERAGVKPAKVEEVSSEEAAPKVEDLHSALKMRVERKHHILILKKQGIRIWLGNEGYVVSSGEIGSPKILEVVSKEGREPELVRGVMESCYGNSASVEVNAFDAERFERLLKAASCWEIVPEGLFRIIDITGLLKAFEKVLSSRAEMTRDFELSLGLRLDNDVDAATVFVNNGRVNVEKGKLSKNYVELDEREAVRILLGGTMPNTRKLGKLSMLLPLPVHVPLLDHV
ncbi:MAG: GNAT family N-acetyltransferase [Candidatus Brockarchaeota archaeon]|nr:GNAT family N-acetyltransferase [Candidatus Brockarchaeota archaeon]